MAQDDGATCIQAKYTVGGGAHAANVTGTTIDTYGFDSVTFYLLPESWTDGTHTFTYQHSDDGTNWTNCTANDFTNKWPMPAAAISSSATALPQKSAYVGTKRYVRGNVAVAGATTGAKYAVPVILSDSISEPVPA